MIFGELKSGDIFLVVGFSEDPNSVTAFKKFHYPEERKEKEFNALNCDSVEPVFIEDNTTVIKIKM